MKENPWKSLAIALIVGLMVAVCGSTLGSAAMADVRTLVLAADTLLPPTDRPAVTLRQSPTDTPAPTQTPVAPTATATPSPTVPVETPTATPQPATATSMAMTKVARLLNPPGGIKWAGTNTPVPVITATPPGDDITDPNYLKAQAAYEAQDYREVLRLSTLVLEANRKLAPAHWYRGMAYYYLDDYESGIVEMEAALAINPRYALAYADRGLLLHALGEVDQAMTDWRRALALDPTLAKVHHNIGVVHYNQGNYDAAVKDYARAVAIDPTRALSWNNLAQAQQKLNQFRDCIANADRAIEHQPDLWVAYCTRSYCLLRLHKEQEAIADMDIFLEHIPDNHLMWYNRGNAYRRLGNLDQAVADYTRSLALEPRFTWALINRSIAYEGQSRYDLKHTDLAEAWLINGAYHKSLDFIDKALQFINPGGSRMARAMRIRGQAHYGLHEYAQAIEALDQAIDIQPSAIAYYYRAMAYRALGDEEQAEEDWSQFTTLVIVPPLGLSPASGSTQLQPVVGDTWIRPTDGAVMVYVPAGEFQMGSTDEQIDFALDLCREHADDCNREIFEQEEQPVHTVTLDGFWMDRTPVTMGQFGRCLSAGGCSYGIPLVISGTADLPVFNVTWKQAKKYCAWVGARLPTEAEWEYAARGFEGWVFPWGNEFDGTRLNYCDAQCKSDRADPSVDDGYPDLAPVDSFPTGVSWCGAYDLAGGVWEWVADWFGTYPSESQENPTGPSVGEYRVLRGGAWNTGSHLARNSTRGWNVPSFSDTVVGFRCASTSRPGEP